MSVKTPRFSGPFKWSALRQQLLSLRDDIHTIRKVAGRNVTIDEHRGKGKVINVNRGAASAPTSECPCALPDADCPHALCFEVNPATQELSDGYWDSGYIAALRAGDDNDIIRPYVYIYDGGGGSYVAGAAAASTLFSGPTVEVPMALEDFFNNWHSVTVKLSSADGDLLTVEICAYGSTASSDFSLGSGNTFATELFVGSQEAYPGPVDLSIRSIQVLANPDPFSSCPETVTEDDFIFPTDSFDSTVGSNQAISGDTVLITSTDGGRNGYIANSMPYYNIRCNDTLFKNRITISPTGNSSISGDPDTICFTYTNDTPQSVLEVDLDPCSSDDAGSYDCRYISTGGSHNDGGNTDLTLMSSCDDPDFPYQLGLNKILAQATLQDSKTTLRILCATEYACEPTPDGSGGCAVLALSDYIDIPIPYQNPTGNYTHTFVFEDSIPGGPTYSLSITITMRIYPVDA